MATGTPTNVVRNIATDRHSVSSDPITDMETKATVGAVVNLFRLWGITDEQAAVLLDLPTKTFARWKTGRIGRLGQDRQARLSNLLGIHQALRTVFSDESRGYAWMKAPNDVFGGKSALDVMLRGNLTDLTRVRRYLDAELGGY